MKCMEGGNEGEAREAARCRCSLPGHARVLALVLGPKYVTVCSSLVIRKTTETSGQREQRVQRLTGKRQNFRKLQKPWYSRSGSRERPMLVHELPRKKYVTVFKLSPQVNGYPSGIFFKESSMTRHAFLENFLWQQCADRHSELGRERDRCRQPSWAVWRWGCRQGNQTTSRSVYEFEPPGTDE